MINYYELILDVMAEKGKTIKDLEENKIIGKNSFYIFSKTAPSLKTLIKISNFLKTSIDYILNRTTENNFIKYSNNQETFFNNLIKLLKSLNISQSKMATELGLSRTNFSRWKNGTEPSLSKLVLIANYLKCNIDDLLELQ